MSRATLFALQHHTKLLLTASALTIITPFHQSAFAQQADCQTGACSIPVRGKISTSSSTHRLPVGANTETGRVTDTPSIPFSISVDGVSIDAGGIPIETTEDRQRKTDLGLSRVDIQVKFDGLDVKPILNVSTVSLRRSYRPGEPVRFLATANYPAFIDRAEIRIYAKDDEPARKKPVVVLPVALNREAGWTMPAQGTGEFAYILRVYDGQGRFDETKPSVLSRSDRAEAMRRGLPAAAGMGEDRTATRNIPVRGGAVTVYGRDVPAGHAVAALGENVPLDANRSFLVQRILPPGEQDVDVSVGNVAAGEELHFSRNINIPDNEWFYVGLADLTIGKRMGDRGIETVRPGEYDKIYSRGRLAFYLKGKIKGEYLLTAAADTGEDDLDRIFRDLDGRNARDLLRRLDPDDYYPVYGDDSTAVEDAPTKGKFYVRLERGDSHVMWGNYKTSITGTEFLRGDRALYGANATYRSQDSTSFGERRSEVTLYAAQPDTVPQLDQFLATGGSAYFLKRQDITRGSETLTVEIRDKVTGRVIERRTLRHGDDYSIDYLQGVVILRRPLSWTTASNAPVRNGALGGNNVYLTVQYEYEPSVKDVDGYLLGGRAQHWVNDKLRVGVTGMDEGTGPANQQAGGADVVLRHSETTFLEAEVARSKGPGFGSSVSTDGGLTVSNSATSGSRKKAATAWRVRGQVDLEDISARGLKGTIGGYYEEKQAGFSTLYDQVTAGRRVWGAHADVALGADWNLKLTYDDFSDDAGKTKREGASSVSWQMDEYWKVSFGLSYTELMSPLAIRSGKPGYNGSRLDAGLRVDYRWDDDHLLYAFGQATLDRSGSIDRNDRGGVGAEIKLTDTVGVSGEVSYGTHGLGGLAAVNYAPDPDQHYYIGYKLDPDRAFELDRVVDLWGTDRGAVVAGMRRRMDTFASAYAESSYDMFGAKRSLLQTYGVIYTPDDVWTVDAGFEAGHIRDDTIDPKTGLQRSDFDRYAPSLAIGYKDEESGITARLRGEVRFEDSEDGTRDQNTYLMAAGVSLKTSDNWRLLAKVDAVFSDAAASASSFQNTDYVEASLGYAYRPVDNDRLNALFRYTWLYDMPGHNPSVKTAVGDAFAPAQRSHILSADFTYDLLPWLSVGGKYGLRYGTVKYRAANGTGKAFVDDWQRSSAHLGIVRADLHIVKKWDMLLEGRVLAMPDTNTIEYGALAALYRHVGDNFKVGVGYNFGRFSDDLRDLTLDDRGVFLNVVGKF